MMDVHPSFSYFPFFMYDTNPQGGLALVPPVYHFLPETQKDDRKKGLPYGNPWFCSILG